MPAMKMEVAMRILFRLLRRRKCSAAELAAEFDISERSIHRLCAGAEHRRRPLSHYTGQEGRNMPARYLPPARKFFHPQGI